MLHRWNFQQKKQTKDQELSIEFYPQGSLPSYLFFWLLQTSWQPELSKHLCYTGGILIWGLVQQKTSKMEMELTICSFAASSGYKEWVTETSSLARDRTIRGSVTCKCAAKGAEKREKILKTWPRVLSTHSLTPAVSYQNHLFHRSSLTITNLSTEFCSKNMKSQGNYINSKTNYHSLGLFFSKYLYSKNYAN